MLGALSMPGVAVEVPSNRKQLSHDRILDVAARALRSDGFDGVGVADVMKRAGLTHGGFYAHFASREVLLVEALERAGQDSRIRLNGLIESRAPQGSSRFRAFVESYLAESHLDEIRSGCPVAALASEMSRQPEAVRAAAVRRIEALTASVASTLDPKLPKDTAAVVVAQAVGALQIARALGNNALGRRHLAASRRHLLEQFDQR